MRKRLIFILHLSTLLLILVSAVQAFIHFKSLPSMQLYVVFAAIFAYIGWGAIYHFLDKRLTLRLLLEYILIGLLALLLFSWTLFS